VTLSDLVGGIDTDREHGKFVLSHYQQHAASNLVIDNSVRATEYTNAQ
jgi:hypothetical protein